MPARPPPPPPPPPNNSNGRRAAPPPPPPPGAFSAKPSATSQVHGNFPPPPPSAPAGHVPHVRPPPPPPAGTEPPRKMARTAHENSGVDSRVLETRKRAWLNAQKHRFGPVKNVGNNSGKPAGASQLVRPPKSEMPPEHLRKIMLDHADLSSRKVASDKRAHLGSLKYMPHAILKLLENMPQPWEPAREVRVLYHTTGAITFVDEIPRVVEPVYTAQWAASWIMMRREKRDRKHFKRMRFPPFDDEEPPLDWMEHLEDAALPDAVQLDAEEYSHLSVFEWLYDEKPLAEYVGSGFCGGSVNGPSYKKWNLGLAAMASLYNLASPLLPHVSDANYYYLFDKRAFFTAKSLNVVVPGGPKYEPLYKDKINNKANEDFTEFNSLDRIIFRVPTRTEYKVAYPYLFNSFVKDVHVPWFHEPLGNHIKEAEDFGSDTSHKPAFVFNEAYNPILPHKFSTKRSEADLLDFDLDDVQVPPDLQPLMASTPQKEAIPLEPENTSAALRLLWAPFPFNRREGNTVRAQDVALVKAWYKERPPPDVPTKVRISYQKLLKSYVLNELKNPPGSKSRSKQAHQNKFNLLKSLKATKYFPADNHRSGGSRSPGMQTGPQHAQPFAPQTRPHVPPSRL
ncbi:hypothetical protein JCM33374_g5070 [Metschnikowia sp. JCM 33374]|nr:hypothetical protein JCM33374_g5070 [Metschnikowia sp. JCM 33374]